MKFSPFSLFCLLLFTFNQWIERWQALPFAHAYLDDLLAPGVVLGIALSFIRYPVLKDPDFQMPLSSILLFLIIYSLLFEVIFPLNDPRHHSDPFDIFAYALGSWLFFKFGNKPAGQSFRYLKKSEAK